ncbi:type 1 glutamine amidotransferase domain-containing protein [Roseibium denhamense]|uniref:Intracellular protease/amidase n=1 Tax=Roseibium denhamense TaxID=76305 RepID=A0ABY1PFA9_9HYPH|nr:type 1 glutamine amidotransferase domain-containing protein [Roseibium denhamense]MTI06274.1 type 1 glutamine amidotransferase domain-containing protein [Roseibium denhamense]SMP32944.1 Putative intracellular protease/amidase [Roseibium denhamense]
MPNTTGPKILMVLTSHEDLGTTGEKTGFWVEEFAAPYYVFKDAGAAITLASLKGGQPPIDPKSSDPSAATDATRRFDADKDAQDQLASTVVLSDVNPDEFDAVFYPGGHGPLWDLTGDKTSIGLIEALFNAGRPVGAVCHAPAVLLNAKTSDGAPLVQGRKVAGFSNDEEDAVGLTNIVPFLLEDELKGKGGHYERADSWASFSVQDGNLFTGQNPASSEAVAHDMLKALG